MFKSKTPDGRNNLCGTQITKHRREMKKSQRELADLLQLSGLDIDKNAVQRMESGQRFVTDIELVHLAKVLHVSLDELIKGTSED